MPAWAVETFDSIYISEVLVENRHGVPAKDGKDHDWIELYNGGSGAVNLAAGFFPIRSRT